LLEITDDIAKWVAHESVTVGMLTVFIRHTSASILIQENADPDVLRDMEVFFAKLVPEDLSLYRHIAEGADDMPAHIKGALTQTNLSIPISRGKMLLGTWQGIYLFEHRQTPRAREIVLHLDGN
jgi:secondary thiamine-phosphate synthase enzyme